MNRVRQPFNVNSIALAAAAAALGDAQFVGRSFEVNRDGMAAVTRGLTRLGLEYIPSFGNFVTFRVRDAAQAFQRLLRLGVIVRPVASYGMPEHLRVTIGTETENTRFLLSLEQALAT
jgi:histidinol-phosphate aminotransferase